MSDPKELLMEKRIGTAIILIENKEQVELMNNILSTHSTIIIARQGVPIREKTLNVISLILEGSIDQINSLTGKLGRLKGMQVKSVLTKSQ